MPMKNFLKSASLDEYIEWCGKSLDSVSVRLLLCIIDHPARDFNFYLGKMSSYLPGDGEYKRLAVAGSMMRLYGVGIIEDDNHNLDFGRNFMEAKCRINKSLEDKKLVVRNFMQPYAETNK